MLKKSVRMTAKARKAISLVSELGGVKTAHLRKDRAAVDNYYTWLTGQGYNWITDKQEWALMTESQERGTVIMLSCASEVAEEIVKIFEEGCTVGGHAIRHLQRETFISSGDMGEIFTIEVML